MRNVKIWMDPRTKGKNGWPVKFVISGDGNRVVMSTGLFAEKEMCDGEFVAGEAGRSAKNAHLTKMKGRATDALLRIMDREMTNAALKRYLDEELFGKKEKRTFLDYAEEYIGTLATASTKGIYGRMTSKVHEYDERVTLNGMDVAWLMSFEAWMRRNDYKTNYIGNIERSIRAVFNYCIDNEYTDKYPFRRFKCKQERTRKRNLTEEDLRELMDFPCEEWQVEYRDIFFLQIFLCGIDIVDLLHMPMPRSLNVGTYLEYKRKKIGVKDAGYAKVRIEPEALDIILKYKGKKMLLNIMEGRYKNHADYLHHMNRALKTIGPTTIGKQGKKEREPLQPELSSKWSRHTWATTAARHGVSVDVIGRAMAHSDGRVTDIYIEWDNRLTDDANRKVIDAVVQRGNR